MAEVLSRACFCAYKLLSDDEWCTEKGRERLLCSLVSGHPLGTYRRPFQLEVGSKYQQDRRTTTVVVSSLWELVLSRLTVGTKPFLVGLGSSCSCRALNCRGRVGRGRDSSLAIRSQAGHAPNPCALFCLYRAGNKKQTTEGWVCGTTFVRAVRHLFAARFSCFMQRFCLLVATPAPFPEAFTLEVLDKT